MCDLQAPPPPPVDGLGWLARAPLAFLAALLAGCSSSGGITDARPAAQALYYRLDTTGLGEQYQTAAHFHAGDLLLRPDHTYTRTFLPLGPGGIPGVGGSDVGTWTQTGTALTLSPDGGGSAVSGAITSDSVRLFNTGDSGSARYVRSVPTGAALPAGVWVLRSINGATATDSSGMVSYEGPFDGGHFVARVRYDTLAFSDGVFARDSWAGTTYSTPAYGIPQTLSYGYQMAAVYDATPGEVIIEYVTPDPHNSADATGYGDLLQVRGDTLIRTLTFSSGPLVQRYVRVR